jgi:DNA polymerase III epsilon subunit-like protein
MTGSVPRQLAGRALTVVDLEGNGQQPPEIVEIALLPIDDDPIHSTDTRSWLVRPQRPITSLVTRKVHRITNEDVAAAPPWYAVAPTIEQLLAGRVLVAHHASVEHRVLSAHLWNWTPPLVLDTLRLARHVWPALPGYGLHDLLRHSHIDTSGIGEQRPHRARYDTWCVWQLLRTLASVSQLSWPALAKAAALPGAGTAAQIPAEPEGGLW